MLQLGKIDRSKAFFDTVWVVAPSISHLSSQKKSHTNCMHIGCLPTQNKWSKVSASIFNLYHNLMQWSDVADFSVICMHQLAPLHMVTSMQPPTSPNPSTLGFSGPAGTAVGHPASKTEPCSSVFAQVHQLAPSGTIASTRPPYLLKTPLPLLIGIPWTHWHRR
jgi:hypothetical protein